MNILFLSINTPPGDKRDTITYNFIKKEMMHLQERGHCIYYLSSLCRDVEEDRINYISKNSLLENNSVFRKIYNLIFAIKHVWFFKLILIKNFKFVLGICGIERACSKIIIKYDIDVIHTNFFEPDGESAVLSSKTFNIPLIATLHGAELRAMPEFNYGACLDQRYKMMLKKSIKYINYFTAPNRQLCKMLHTDFNVPNEKIKYVPNGVEKIHIKKGITKADKYLNCIAICNMIELKNLDIIFQSFAELSKKFNYLRIFIVGGGPLRDKYEDLIIELDLKYVSIIDEMPKNELFKLVSTCDLLIHPSFSEGMPTVVLESLSIGVPCLVSNIPAHHELIKEGENGFLFDPFDQNDFIKKMELILSDKDALNKLRDNCINSIKKYSIDRKIDSYIKIYESALLSH